MLLIRNGEIVAIDLRVELKERFPPLLVEGDDGDLMTSLSQVVDLAREYAFHTP